MRLHLLAVGTRVPHWVETGFAEYSARLPRHLRPVLHEIPTEARSGAGPADRYRAKECERILAAVPKGAALVALDGRGRSWSTAELAERLRAWMSAGRDLALAIGGPDGLDPHCLELADEQWSLSALTFPHALVRVIVAEQLYRAWTLLEGHPYHRA
jgi:23S rRNA (pseudouridine1915-N3)-methyltransferase